MFKFQLGLQRNLGDSKQDKLNLDLQVPRLDF